MALSFLGGIAKIGGGVVGTLTGATTILATVDAVLNPAGGTSSGGGGFRLCPGTPPDLAAAVVKRLKAFPALGEQLRTFWRNERQNRKLQDGDWTQIQSAWTTPEGLAVASVWAAWGGADCKLNQTYEGPRQTELWRIAALPLPAGFTDTPSPVSGTGSGSNTFSGQPGATPTLATTATSGIAASLLPILVIAAATIAVVLIRRRK